MGYMQALYFRAEDLLVSRVERDRFEREHKLQLQPPWTKRIWGWLRDQANQKALTMLWGWVAAGIAALWAAWVWWHQACSGQPDA
jgi:hypothetical protein